MLPKKNDRTPKTRRSRATGGNLRIGSHWNAITIIARSQTHPLKAVCELVENSIDARARTIGIIRMRRKGKTMLEIIDDGQGLPLDAEGKPDFAFIATHVCDSMKRGLAEHERRGVHGEFGIGLLSFWSLGHQIRLVSATRDGQLMEMLLERGRRNYEVRHVRGELPSRGTRVIVGPLLEATRNIVTGEKLGRYLAAELRDRIRRTGIVIRVTDRLIHKDFILEPRAFEGTPIKEIRTVETPFGALAAELYVRAPSDREGAGVAICKDGTRVLRDVTELIPLARPPWTSSRIEGIIDYPALNIAPGTRSGVIPDERFDALVAALTAIEPAVAAAIAAFDAVQTEQASREILRQLQRAFRNALKQLPSHEYLFFDVPSEPGTAGGAARGHDSPAPGTTPGAPVEGEDAGAPLDAQPAATDAALPDGEEEVLLPCAPGPLASVRIVPRFARARPGGEVALAARACDTNGVRINAGVAFAWRIAAGAGTLRAEPPERAWVSAGAPCEVVVAVTAAQAERTAEAECRVKFIEGADAEGEVTAKGLPAYRLESAPGAPWRSRYDADANEIVVNSAHRDYLACRSTAAKHRRYLGKLYAKEIVLLNFPHDSVAGGMDRLIEVLLRTEDEL